MELPAPVIDRYGDILVVRDDLLPGGTKRRFLYRYLQSAPHIREWVYASPRVGYAQVALGYACRDLGLKATVVLPKGKHTPLTEEAIRIGVNVIEVPMGFLSHTQHVAKEYATATTDAALLPFGLDHPLVIEEIARIARTLPVTPSEVWTCISSGVLSRGLQQAWPEAVVYGVRVGHATTDAERGRAVVMDAPYKFVQPCRAIDRPPFPSSVYYDAKVWSFIRQRASRGALFWNVGA